MWDPNALKGVLPRNTRSCSAHAMSSSLISFFHFYLSYLGKVKAKVPYLNYIAARTPTLFMHESVHAKYSAAPMVALTWRTFPAGIARTASGLLGGSRNQEGRPCTRLRWGTLPASTCFPGCNPKNQLYIWRVDARTDAWTDSKHIMPSSLTTTCCGNVRIYLYIYTGISLYLGPRVYLEDKRRSLSLCTEDGNYARS